MPCLVVDIKAGGSVFGVLMIYVMTFLWWIAAILKIGGPFGYGFCHSIEADRRVLTVLSGRHWGDIRGCGLPQGLHGLILGETPLDFNRSFKQLGRSSNHTPENIGT